MLDEPVAGMSVRERAKLRPSCSNASARTASVLVIEHDMKFVKDIAAQGDRAAPGTDPVRGHRWKRSRTIRKVIEVYLGH